jgi:hypothetical protein
MLIALLTIVALVLLTLEVVSLNQSGLFLHMRTQVARLPWRWIFLSMLVVVFGFRTWMRRDHYCARLKQIDWRKAAAIILALWASCFALPFALSWQLGSDYLNIVLFERAALVILACIPIAFSLIERTGKTETNWPEPAVILVTAAGAALLATAAVTSIYLTRDDHHLVALYLCRIEDREFSEYSARAFKEHMTFISGAGCSPSHMTWRDYLANLFGQSLLSSGGK